RRAASRLIPGSPTKCPFRQQLAGHEHRRVVPAMRHRENRPVLRGLRLQLRHRQAPLLAPPRRRAPLAASAAPAPHAPPAAPAPPTFGPARISDPIHTTRPVSSSSLFSDSIPVRELGSSSDARLAGH